MTNKDLLNAMQHLDAKYTDEADRRADNASVQQPKRIRLMPALAALGGAAACFALLLGMMHMHRTDDLIQTAESVLSDVIAEETLPAASESEALAKQTETEVTAPAETAPENAAVYSYAPAETTTAAAKETAPAETVTAPKKPEPAKAETPASQTEPPAEPEQPTVTTAKKADKTPAEPVQTEAPAPEVKYTNPTLILDNVTAEAGEVVPIRISIVNNPGLAVSGVRINYDAALGVQTYIVESKTADSRKETVSSAQETPDYLKDPVDFFSRLLNRKVTEEEAAEMLKDQEYERNATWDEANRPESSFGAVTFSEVRPNVTYGSIAGEMQFATSVNTDNHCVSYAQMTGLSEDITEDGTIITFYFVVPQDAESGTVYTLIPKISEWKNSRLQDHQIDTVNGSITVK